MTVGNAEVIELLEAYLDEAKKKRWGHLAISMVGHPNIACTDFAGDISLEVSQREAIAMLDRKLRRSIDSWSFPARNEQLDASYVRYNVANGPLGFDFLIWLIDAEMTRVRERAPMPLKVGFWLGHESGVDRDYARRQRWLDNVFRPCLKFIGAVEDPGAIYGRCKQVFVPRDIVAAVLDGEKVPRLRPVAPVRDHGAVTITLREADYGMARNSRLGHWLAAADVLNARGEKVVFVRDTAKAYEELGNYVTEPRASLDLDYRLAFYEGAKANLFVSNGPNGLAMFGTRPMLMFIPPDSGNTDEIVNTPESWIKLNGIKWGTQFPWCNDNQRIVWEDDTWENITKAWEQLTPALDCAA